MKVDLHLHTTASDGTDKPSSLVRKLKKLRFTHAAITDHDTFDGCGEAIAAGKRCGVTIIPGIELSADAGTEVHVLGYGLARTDEAYQRTTALKAQRDARMCEMVKKLNRIGVEITAEEVRGIAKGAAGRAHIARLLVRKNYAPDIKEAFAQYLSPGRAAYIPREKIEVFKAVQWIRGQEGVPVLAHPGLIDMDGPELKALIGALKDEGLVGIEAYHPGHLSKQCLIYDRMGRDLGLIVTGGSDYHGENKAIEPGFRLERWKKMDEDFMNLFHKIPILGLK